MPPFLPRKRRSPSPPRKTLEKPAKRPRLADALDAEAIKPSPSRKQTELFLLGSDSNSSLSDVDSDEFEDVPVKDQKHDSASRPAPATVEHEEDDDVEWEDAAVPEAASAVNQEALELPMSDGPIQLTFRKDDNGYDFSAAVAASGQKKGPTRREKQARILAHQMHVQFLLFHNAVRNSWISDKVVHKTLLEQLPSQIATEVEKWRTASGLEPPETKAQQTTARARKGRKGQKAVDKRGQRDWGQPSQRLDAGRPDMSHGDPIIALLKILVAYWKKKFVITAPGLRKKGYGTKHGLRQVINSYRHDEHDPERHGEKVQNIEEFRNIATKCEGSRDIGAQMFTALLRALDIEARMVASLQPCGYGFTKAEQMSNVKSSLQAHESHSLSSSEGETPSSTTKHSNSVRKARPTARSKSQNAKHKLIDLDTDAESHAGSEADDASVIDVTPSTAKQKRSKYDRDLLFPIYWTEVISPVTNKVLPVSPLIVENPLALTPEALAMLEPRGAKAEKARQIMAYVVAHSSDGTAKDVTVRYLRKRLWPGKTKGFRLPVEKVPVYDKKGRITRYEDYDWFKYIMSLYGRSHSMRTAVDDVEESSDLVPQQPAKKDDHGVDTLQSLKASADFVLERFLRREEALRPGAEPVRQFVSGKGDKYKEENVYRRADVERCLTAESWHKEGRRPKLGENAMKFVPVRAVTLTRKREAEEHERQTGEKQMQGLYSLDQTEYIIPPPIVDGVIPKNVYGNMDCFAPSMVPRGAVHIPLRGTVRICKRLDIDFAEAVTGFEFGNKRAVPVCTGVVVAEENEKIVRDAWEEWNIEQQKKQETKMEALVLGLWRKFIMGLRIRERIVDEYGDELGLDTGATGLHKDDPVALDDEDENAGQDLDGGFVADEDEEMGGEFLMLHEDDMSEAEDLVMDDGKNAAINQNGISVMRTAVPLDVPSTATSDRIGKVRELNGSPASSPVGSDEDAMQSMASGSGDEPMDFAPIRSAPKRNAQARGAQQKKTRTTALEGEVVDSTSESKSQPRNSRSKKRHDASAIGPEQLTARHQGGRAAKKERAPGGLMKTEEEAGNSNDDDDDDEEERESNESEKYTRRATRSRRSIGQAASQGLAAVSIKRESQENKPSEAQSNQPSDLDDRDHEELREPQQTPEPTVRSSKTKRASRSKRAPRNSSTKVTTSPYFQD